MTRPRHTISGADAPLAAHLDLPAGPPLGLALLAALRHRRGGPDPGGAGRGGVRGRPGLLEAERGVS